MILKKLCAMNELKIKSSKMFFKLPTLLLVSNGLLYYGNRLCFFKDPLQKYILNELSESFESEI